MKLVEELLEEYLSPYHKKNSQCYNPDGTPACSDLRDGVCKRVGSNGQVGVCWIEPSEEEY